MADRSTSTYAAFLVPWYLTTDDLDASESSYTQDGPLPGSVSPSSTVSLQVIATGAQDTTGYTLTTRQGGNVGPDGAAFTWRRDTESAGQDRGWDAYNLWSEHRFLAFTNGAVTTLATPHAVTMADGTVIVVAHYVSATYRVRAYALDASTGEATTTDIYTSTAAPSAQLSSSWHPTVCALPDGSVICAHLVEDTTSEEAQVRIHRTTDGITWTEVSSYALDTAVDVDNNAAGDGFLIRRMRIACNGDQVLLLLWVNPSDTGSGTYYDGYIQYGSTSEGLQFSLVETYTANGLTGATVATENVISPDVCVLFGTFHVVYAISSDNLFHRGFTSAFTPMSEVTGEEVQAGGAYVIVTFDGSSVSDEVDLICFADPDGSLYVTFRDTNGDEVIITRSTDLGETWTRMGDGLASGTRAWWPDAAVTYPTDMAATVSGGRALIYGRTGTTATTYDSSLNEWAVGGWSSVTVAGNTEFGRITGRMAWINAYIPADSPSNSGWTTTTGGTSTGALSSGIWSETTTTGQRYNSKAITGSIAEGVVFEFVVQQGSGSTLAVLRSGVRAHLDDGATNGYGVQIRLAASGSSQIALYDDVAGTIIGSAATVDWANTYEVRVEMRGTSAQAWYRVFNEWGDKLWTSLASTASLTNSGGGGSSVIAWGTAHAAASTTATDWRRIAYASDEYTGVRSLPIANPTDLFPRPYAGVGASTVLEGGLGIYAVGGPGRGSDAYTLEPRYEYPIDALTWPSSPSLRERWRSVQTSSPSLVASQQIIAFRVSEKAGEDTALPAVIGVFLAGLKGTATGNLLVINSGGTTTHAFDLSEQVTATRAGNTLIPNDAGTTGRFFQTNELKGWTAYYNTAGVDTTVEVTGNTAGVLAGASSNPVRITVSGLATGTGTTGTLTLTPPQAVILLHNEGVSAEVIAVDLDSQVTIDRRHHLSACWIGEVVIPGPPWENGERISTIPGGAVSYGTDRTPYATEPAPSRREGEIAFSTVHHTGATQGSAVDPDFLKASSGASAIPAGAPDAVPYTTEGISHLINGARPVVLLRQFNKLPNGATKTEVLTGRWRAIPCHITGSHTLRRVVGDDEASSLVLRGEAWAWTEVV